MFTLACANKRGRPKCPYRTAALQNGEARYTDALGNVRYAASGNKVNDKQAWELNRRRAAGIVPKTREAPETYAAKNRANVKRWRKENPEKKLAHQRRRRAGMAGYVTPEHIELLRFKQDDQCFYCAGPLEPETFDHFIPLSRNGEHSVDNGRLACNICNVRKKNMRPRDFFIKVWNTL